MLKILPEPIDALDQSLQQTATEHKGAAVANKGKRYAGDRHEPDGHGNIDENMDRKQHRHAKREECTKTVASEARDANSIHQNQTKQTENRNASQKSFFLRENGEDKIVMRDAAR